MFKRKPDFIIGDNYLHRWWVIPRNRFFNIYLHKIMRSDDDRALHDHPWLNCSILLSGSYREHMPHGAKVRTAGSIIFRRAVAAHRIEVVDGPIWTIFITGPVIRTWGFHCPKRWVPWREFVDDRDAGKIGKGCAE